jgi:hypothetical protein
MERRELIKIMTMAVGGTVALPETVFARIGEAFNPADLTFFRPSQQQQVAILAEAIIPKTDTPGAIEAEVPGWIEILVKDCLDETDQDIITAGLADIMKRCVKDTGMGMDKLSPEKQVAFLTAYDAETTSARNKLIEAGEQPRMTFLQQFKELTKFCYVNSEVGATQAFNFELVPGKWIPDMPLEPGMKAYPI